MDEIIQYFMGSPLPVAFVGSHYLYYSLAAYAVVAVRLVTGRFSKAEWGLFAIWLVCMTLEFVQLGVDGFKFGGDKTWGLPRYFGVFAPLMWVWSAYALTRLWSWPKTPRGRLACRAAIGALFAWIVISEDYRQIRSVYTEGSRPDVIKACTQIAKVIRRDYAGPRRQAEAKRTLKEYFTTRRPVVFSDFAAAAWVVRGQSEGALHCTGACPWPDDYLFLRVGSGYGPSDTVDARVYDYVCSVPGVGTEWRLFRRKTTPHRLAPASR